MAIKVDKVNKAVKIKEIIIVIDAMQVKIIEVEKNLVSIMDEERFIVIMKENLNKTITMDMKEMHLFIEDMVYLRELIRHIVKVELRFRIKEVIIIVMFIIIITITIK